MLFSSNCLGIIRIGSQLALYFITGNISEQIAIVAFYILQREQLIVPQTISLNRLLGAKLMDPCDQGVGVSRERLKSIFNISK
ncbi:hypothetical protein WJ07_20170 [Burkholderia vietnamiensis]|nr:hypothetical protein WJ07_20170 [Burkholderia vietnamiensis]